MSLVQHVGGTPPVWMLRNEFTRVSVMGCSPVHSTTLSEIVRTKPIQQRTDHHANASKRVGLGCCTVTDRSLFAERLQGVPAFAGMTGEGMVFLGWTTFLSRHSICRFALMEYRI
jgi:hypothetical protein